MARRDKRLGWMDGTGGGRVSGALRGGGGDGGRGADHGALGRNKQSGGSIRASLGGRSGSCR